jgi:carboxyl-terminal processing protease
MTVIGRAAVIAVLTVVLSIPVASADNPYQALKLFTEVLELVRKKYVEGIGRDSLTLHGLRGLLDTLDSNSLYLADVTHKRFLRPGPLSLPHFGVTIGLRGERLVVVAPLPGSPAAVRGVLPGDRVLEIQGTTTAGMSLREALESLADREEVELLLWRQSLERALKVKLEGTAGEGGPLVLPLEAGVGYVKPGWMVTGAADQTLEELDRLLAARVQGLILDLRASPGSDLSEAAALADALLGPGLTIGYTIERAEDGRTEYVSRGEAALPPVPVVALVGPGTCCAGEMLAAALKHHARAVLVGGETFGKGTLQEVLPLTPSSAIAVTHARWYTPEGLCVDRELGGWDPSLEDATPTMVAGVTPHLAVSPDPGAPLEAALRAAGLLDPTQKHTAPTAAILAERGFVFLPSEDEVDSALGMRENAGEPIFPAELEQVALRRIEEENAQRDTGEGSARAVMQDPLVAEALSILADPVRVESVLNGDADSSAAGADEREPGATPAEPAGPEDEP